MKRLVVFVAAVAVGFYLGCPCTHDSPVGKPIPDGWWGKGAPMPDTDLQIRDFHINVSDAVLDDLAKRLSNTRLGEDLENTEFQYGFQVDYMREVLQHWQKNYKWRTWEEKLNKYSHYKTNIEGIDVYFLRVKPSNTEGRLVRPMLMIHGWPGSVWEFDKILPLLTNPAEHGGDGDVAFEMICPSIPGYGFSEAPHQQGFDGLAAARVFVKLMERLGHKQFYTQGGDWGGMISMFISQAYPQHVLGAHLIMYPPPQSSGKYYLKQVVGYLAPSLIGLTPRQYQAWYPVTRNLLRLLQETGYMHLQATKPDTIAFALLDSPVGLAAYILEKFSTWTNREFNQLDDGGLTRKYSMDDLLTNVMVYWVTGSIGSSMRFYKEVIGSQARLQWANVPVTVPTGLACFPHDLVAVPRAFAEVKYHNIVQFTDMEDGGHFAAMELPAETASDIWAFVRKVEQQQLQR